MTSKQDNTLRKLSTQRLPPPALFQGPSSRNASSLSLTPTQSATSAGRQSSISRPFVIRGRSFEPRGSLQTRSSLSPFAASRSRSPGGRTRGEAADATDAIWQNMQNSLAEVELSATSGDNVFGEKHSKALEELRTKQMKLARAWARNEADYEIVDADRSPPGVDNVNDGGNDNQDGKNNNNNNNNSIGSNDPSGNSPTTKKKSGTSGPAVGVGSAAAVEQSLPGSIGADGLSYKTLDEETDRDIILARERREANDRYFNRINNGVLDVVSKLEEVARAMRTVEKESQDIWSDSDSSGVSSPRATNK